MFGRCRHRWEEVGTVFTRPYNVGHGGNVQGTIEMLDRLMYGFTTTKLRCSECGDVKTHVGLGDLR